MKKNLNSIFAVLCTGTCHCCSDRSLRLIRKYTPSKEHEDLTTYYHLTNSDEVAIV